MKHLTGDRRHKNGEIHGRHTGDRTYTVYTISMTRTCMYMIRVCSCLHTLGKECMIGFINA